MILSVADNIYGTPYANIKFFNNNEYNTKARPYALLPESYLHFEDKPMI